MKKENTRSPKNEAVQKKETISWTNVHDDNEMREMGFLRPFNQTPRDKGVWTKTPYEKRILKRMRHSYKGGDTHFHSVPRKTIRVRCKLIVNLFKNEHFGKTTYSTKCWQHEIPEILARYQVTNNKTKQSASVVRKYSWNGRTYSPSELPFGG